MKTEYRIEFNEILIYGNCFSPGGGIGRRDRFRIYCLRACEFESRPGHH